MNWWVQQWMKEWMKSECNELMEFLLFVTNGINFYLYLGDFLWSFHCIVFIFSYLHILHICTFAYYFYWEFIAVTGQLLNFSKLPLPTPWILILNAVCSKTLFDSQASLSDLSPPLSDSQNSRFISDPLRNTPILKMSTSRWSFLDLFSVESEFCHEGLLP